MTTRCLKSVTALILASDLITSLPAQPDASAETRRDEPIVLSPFVVATGQDRGYAAMHTLAGSRLNAALKDVPAAISVFNKEFLDDAGLTNVTDALAYGLNAIRDYPNQSGLPGAQQDDLSLKIRGLANASLGRNYFVWNISSDTYNVDRLDFSRGPNSILFGIGGPGGIINITTKQAQLRKIKDQVQIQMGSWSSARMTADVNRVLHRNLALRANFLYEHKYGWRDFEQGKHKAASLATFYQPFKGTTIRLEGEYGLKNQIIPHPFVISDFASAWINAGRPISPDNTTAVAGTSPNTAKVLVYENTSPLGPISWAGSRMTTFGIADPLLPTVRIAYPDYALAPKSTNLQGPGSWVDVRYKAFTGTVEQVLGNLHVELAFNLQGQFRHINMPLSFQDEGLRGDANALLPNKTVNPHAGELYVESQAHIRDISWRGNTYRATFAYNLDAEKHNGWLGRHQFVGLVMREMDNWYTDYLSEVNLTPSGVAPFTADLTAGPNRILRRTYVDFSSSDPAKRGMQDPAPNPIVGLNGVHSGWARTSAGDSGINRTLTDSVMAATQSALLHDHLVLTFGWRRDLQTFWRLNPSRQRNPVTREWIFPELNVEPDIKSGGNTRTFGAVYHVTSWLSFLYNNANNFVPQSGVDVGGIPLGPQLGKGEDVGARVTFLNDRIAVRAGHYRIQQANSGANRNFAAFVSPIREIWTALGQKEKVPEANSQDVYDNVGSGWELDLTANPGRGLKLMLNASRAEVTRSNTFPRALGYIAGNRTLWQQNASVPLEQPSNISPTATIGDALGALDKTIAQETAANGQVPLLYRKYSANAFASYSPEFGPRWLREFSLGLGGNYQGRAVIGYDLAHNKAPVYGNSSFLLNGLVSRRFKLARGQSLRLRLNVQNLLNRDDPLAVHGDGTFNYRYQLQNPRSWILTAIFDF